MMRVLVSAKIYNKLMRQAKDRVRAEISENASRSRIASGLAGEGYAGGYLQALYDIELLLGGVLPSTRGYWRDGV